MEEKTWEIIMTNDTDYDIDDCTVGIFIGTEDDVKSIVKHYNDVEPQRRQLLVYVDDYHFWYREYVPPFIITKENALGRLHRVFSYEADCALPSDDTTRKEYNELFEGEIK